MVDQQLVEGLVPFQKLGSPACFRLPRHAGLRRWMGAPRAVVAHSLGAHIRVMRTCTPTGINKETVGPRMGLRLCRLPLAIVPKINTSVFVAA